MRYTGLGTVKTSLKLSEIVSDLLADKQHNVSSTELKISFKALLYPSCLELVDGIILVIHKLVMKY